MQTVGRPYVMAGVALAGAGLIAVTPIVSPADLPRHSNEPVRLTSTAADDLQALLTGILGGTPVTNLGTITGDLTAINDAIGLNSLLGDLGSGASGIASNLTNLGNLADGIDLGGLQNVPYNLIADLVNIPYYESLALQEEAFALGPAGSVGGVAGWIPPGATVENGGVDVINGQDYYALGGTGSYLYESVGNTWGWDDGNWPQVDGLAHFLLPFQFEENITEQVQGILQAESIDGADVNCEFQCASFADYLGQWFHVPLSQLEAGYTYPTVLADTVGATGPLGEGIVNSGGTAGQDVIWSGQHFTLDPTLGIEAIGQNLTSSPANDPIEFVNPASLLLNSELLSYDINYDFNFLTEGSFAFWGASSLYSVPDLIGGAIKDVTGIPNQFLLPNLGAEPLSGYTDSYSSLLPNLAEGFQYLLHGAGVPGADGLLGYLEPSTYLEAIANDTGGLMGAAGTTLPTELFGSFDPSTLLGSFDPTTIATDLSTALSNATNDIGATLGPDLALNLFSSIF
jgi:hypothetical protein